MSRTLPTGDHYYSVELSNVDCHCGVSDPGSLKMDPGSLKNLLSQHGESHLFDNSVVTMEASNRLRFVKPIDGSGRFTIGELVIVIGEERSWLSEERARHYVMTARLPMVCRVDLFNVSVGTTVAMDEVVRQSMVSW